MSRIEVEPPKGVRKGESSTLFIRIPQTKTIKEIALRVPRGVNLPDGGVFRLAPKVKSANIPVTFSHTAPDRVKVRIDVKAESGEHYKLVESFKIRR